MPNRASRRRELSGRVSRWAGLHDSATSRKRRRFLLGHAAEGGGRKVGSKTERADEHIAGRRSHVRRPLGAGDSRVAAKRTGYGRSGRESRSVVVVPGRAAEEETNSPSRCEVSVHPDYAETMSPP